MWFNDDLIIRRHDRSKKGSSRGKFLLVNTKLRSHGASWAPRVAMVVLFVVIAGASAVVARLAAIEAWGAAFTENNDYILTNVAINVRGGDNGLTNLFLRKTGVTVGEDNLFGIDIGSVRETLEKIANVRDVQIYRSLPGTLEVGAYRRIPMARLGYSKHRARHLVIDDDGVVFVEPSMRSIERLPVIGGYKNSAGKVATGAVLGGRANEMLAVLAACQNTPFIGTIVIDAINARQGYLAVKLEQGCVAKLAWHTGSQETRQANTALQGRLVAWCATLHEYEKAGVDLETVDLRFDSYTNRVPATPPLAAGGR